MQRNAAVKRTTILEFFEKHHFTVILEKIPVRRDSLSNILNKKIVGSANTS